MDIIKNRAKLGSISKWYVENYTERLWCHKFKPWKNDTSYKQDEMTRREVYTILENKSSYALEQVNRDVAHMHVCLLTG